MKKPLPTLNEKNFEIFFYKEKQKSWRQREKEDSTSRGWKLKSWSENWRYTRRTARENCERKVRAFGRNRYEKQRPSRCTFLTSFFLQTALSSRETASLRLHVPKLFLFVDRIVSAPSETVVEHPLRPSSAVDPPQPETNFDVDKKV